MTYDPAKRDSSWTMIQPGCYVDRAHRAHIFPDEILAFLQTLYPSAGFDANSRDDYELVVKLFKQELRKQHPDIEFQVIQHERLKH